MGASFVGLALLLLLSQQGQSAPVVEEGTDLQEQDDYPAEGCYYNLEHYEEGDRIVTNEPCLNCTCHNHMLMCYLRVCPFTKAIGQDCTVEKRPDQCCPVITCPEVPVQLLTSSTTQMPTTTSTALGRPDNYGCTLNDNTFYPDGAQVPSDPRKPCELCYCIRNRTACVMQECTLHVEGCKPVYQPGVCCPVRYDCDYDSVTTPGTTVGLVTTPGGPSQCLHDGVVYNDGEMVEFKGKSPCEHCYCMRGDVVCAVQECGAPLQAADCEPLPPPPGHCCPDTFQCANGTVPLETLLGKPESQDDSHSSEVHSSESGPSQEGESDSAAEGSESSEEQKKPQDNISEDESSQTNQDSPSEVEDNTNDSHTSGEMNDSSPITERPLVDSDAHEVSTGDKIPVLDDNVETTNPHVDSEGGVVSDQVEEVDQQTTEGTESEVNKNTEGQKIDNEQVTYSEHDAKPVELSPESLVHEKPEEGHTSTNEQPQTESVNNLIEEGTKPTHETGESATVAGEIDHEEHGSNADSISSPDIPEIDSSVLNRIPSDEISGEHTQFEHLPVNADNADSTIQMTEGPNTVNDQNEEDGNQQAGVSHDGQDVLNQNVIDDIPEKPTDEEHTSTSTFEPTFGHPDSGETMITGDHDENHKHTTLYEGEDNGNNDGHNQEPGVTQQTYDSDKTNTEENVEAHESASSEKPATEFLQENIGNDEEVKPESEDHDMPENDPEKNRISPVTPDTYTEVSVETVEVHTSTPEISRPFEGSTSQANLIENIPSTEGPTGIHKDVQASFEPDSNQNEYTTSHQGISIPPEDHDLTTVIDTGNIPRIPGEGNCVIDGQTYKHNSEVHTSNACQVSCKCLNSIVHCKLVECPPPPTQYANCMPLQEPDSCCPSYTCDDKPSVPLESHSQVSTEYPDAAEIEESSHHHTNEESHLEDHGPSDNEVPSHDQAHTSSEGSESLPDVDEKPDFVKPSHGSDENPIEESDEDSVNKGTTEIKPEHDSGIDNTNTDKPTKVDEFISQEPIIGSNYNEESQPHMTPTGTDEVHTESSENEPKPDSGDQSTVNEPLAEDDHDTTQNPNKEYPHHEDFQGTNENQDIAADGGDKPESPEGIVSETATVDHENTKPITLDENEEPASSGEQEIGSVSIQGTTASLDTDSVNRVITTTVSTDHSEQDPLEKEPGNIDSSSSINNSENQSGDENTPNTHSDDLTNVEGNHPSFHPEGSVEADQYGPSEVHENNKAPEQTIINQVTNNEVIHQAYPHPDLPEEHSQEGDEKPEDVSETISAVENSESQPSEETHANESPSSEDSNGDSNDIPTHEDSLDIHGPNVAENIDSHPETEKEVEQSSSDEDQTTGEGNENDEKVSEEHPQNEIEHDNSVVNEINHDATPSSENHTAQDAEHGSDEPAIDDHHPIDNAITDVQPSNNVQEVPSSEETHHDSSGTSIDDAHPQLEEHTVDQEELSEGDHDSAHNEVGGEEQEQPVQNENVETPTSSQDSPIPSSAEEDPVSNETVNSDESESISEPSNNHSENQDVPENKDHSEPETVSEETGSHPKPSYSNIDENLDQEPKPLPESKEDENSINPTTNTDVLPGHSNDEIIPNNKVDTQNNVISIADGVGGIVHHETPNEIEPIFVGVDTESHNTDNETPESHEHQNIPHFEDGNQELSASPDGGHESSVPVPGNDKTEPQEGDLTSHTETVEGHQDVSNSNVDVDNQDLPVGPGISEDHQEVSTSPIFTEPNDNVSAEVGLGHDVAPTVEEDIHYEIPTSAEDDNHQTVSGSPESEEEHHNQPVSNEVSEENHDNPSSLESGQVSTSSEIEDGNQGVSVSPEEAEVPISEEEQDTDQHVSVHSPEDHTSDGISEEHSNEPGSSDVEEDSSSPSSAEIEEHHDMTTSSEAEEESHNIPASDKSEEQQEPQSSVESDGHPSELSSAEIGEGSSSAEVEEGHHDVPISSEAGGEHDVSSSGEGHNEPSSTEHETQGSSEVGEQQDVTSSAETGEENVLSSGEVEEGQNESSAVESGEAPTSAESDAHHEPSSAENEEGQSLLISSEVGVPQEDIPASVEVDQQSVPEQAESEGNIHDTSSDEVAEEHNAVSPPVHEEGHNEVPLSVESEDGNTNIAPPEEGSQLNGDVSEEDKHQNEPGPAESGESDDSSVGEHHDASPSSESESNASHDDSSNNEAGTVPDDAVDVHVDEVSLHEDDRPGLTSADHHFEEHGHAPEVETPVEATHQDTTTNTEHGSSSEQPNVPESDVNISHDQEQPSDITTHNDSDQNEEGEGESHVNIPEEPTITGSPPSFIENETPLVSGGDDHYNYGSVDNPSHGGNIDHLPAHGQSGEHENSQDEVNANVGETHVASSSPTTEQEHPSDSSTADQANVDLSHSGDESINPPEHVGMEDATESLEHPQEHDASNQELPSSHDVDSTQGSSTFENEHSRPSEEPEVAFPHDGHGSPATNLADSDAVVSAIYAVVHQQEGAQNVVNEETPTEGENAVPEEGVEVSDHFKQPMPGQDDLLIHPEGSKDGQISNHEVPTEDHHADHDEDSKSPIQHTPEQNQNEDGLNQDVHLTTSQPHTEEHHSEEPDLTEDHPSPSENENGSDELAHGVSEVPPASEDAQPHHEDVSHQPTTDENASPIPESDNKDQPNLPQIQNQNEEVSAPEKEMSSTDLPQHAVHHIPVYSPDSGDDHSIVHPGSVDEHFESSTENMPTTMTHGMSEPSLPSGPHQAQEHEYFQPGGPLFTNWSQKPMDHVTTTKQPQTSSLIPEDSQYPYEPEQDYEDEDSNYSPGTCRYGGKVYLSAQQIPRDDPCDFCFCFRSDIICLQQSCPPPIQHCYQENIPGFCCPRYECHVSMATMVNVTTTTTTTTTTLPPHFLAHAYKGAAKRTGCQVKGVAYRVGERIPSTSGPCLECRCGADGQMKCDPTVCNPQETLLRQVMDAAVINRRRRHILTTPLFTARRLR